VQALFSLALQKPHHSATDILAPSVVRMDLSKGVPLYGFATTVAEPWTSCTPSKRATRLRYGLLSDACRKCPFAGSCCGALRTWPPSALPGQLHLQQGHEQLSPVFDRTHDAVNLQAVSPVVHLKGAVAAAAFEQETRILLPLPASVKRPHGEVAIGPDLGKFAIHSWSMQAGSPDASARHSPLSLLIRLHLPILPKRSLPPQADPAPSVAQRQLVIGDAVVNSRYVDRRSSRPVAAASSRRTRSRSRGSLVESRRTRRECRGGMGDGVGTPRP